MQPKDGLWPTCLREVISLSSSAALRDLAAVKRDESSWPSRNASRALSPVKAVTLLMPCRSMTSFLRHVLDTLRLSSEAWTVYDFRSTCFLGNHHLEEPCIATCARRCMSEGVQGTLAEQQRHQDGLVDNQRRPAAVHFEQDLLSLLNIKKRLTDVTRVLLKLGADIEV